MSNMKEKCQFSMSCVATEANTRNLKLFTNEPFAVGDTVHLKYSIDINYMGQLANRLEALLALGCDMRQGQSTDVLIKRVFNLLSAKG